MDWSSTSESSSLPSVSESENKSTNSRVRIINALDFPKPKWNPERKCFYLIHDKLSLHGDADAKKNVFVDRYHILLQRLKRIPTFSNPKDGFQLTSIDSLVGSPGKKYVFGLLSQLTEGRFYLEDPKSSVPITLDDASFSPGLVTEGCFVIAEGEYIDGEGTFRAHVVGLPPAEPRFESKELLGNMDLFAPPLPREYSTKFSKLFVENEEMDVSIPPNSEFVILSDVHLDDPKVVEKLREVFIEYQDEPPTMFIFMGNFSSVQFSVAQDYTHLRGYFDKLASMILSFPVLAQTSHFVFVPGPTDPGGDVVNILPKAPLAKAFTKLLRERLPNSHFTSNPARIRFYGQDIVLFRENIVNRMRRHCIKPPKDGDDINTITGHLVKTLLDEAHLCPLNISVRPVFWNYDHAMYLYPLPDTVILADKYDQYEHIYDSCLAFNPGSFATDFSFIAYRPATKEVQFSRIDETL